MLADVTPAMAVAKEEAFRPGGAAVFRFTTGTRRSHMANDTEFGLAYFYSEGPRPGMARVAPAGSTAWWASTPG